MASRAPRVTISLLSLTTSITAMFGVALAEAVPAHAAVPVAVVAPAPAVTPAPHPAIKPSPKAVAVHTTPKPKAKPKPKPSPTATHVVHRTVTASPAPAPRKTTTASLTKQQLMMRAVDRIPGYNNGEAFWVLKDMGSWGLAVMGGGTVYIAPRVPSGRMYDVVAHEWSHLLSVKVYGNDVQAAMDAMNAWFGGTDLTGAERAADCMALQLGAKWTHYTPCTNTKWREGARRLLARQKL